MRNHTTNLAERAASIADREKQKIWEKTGDPKECLRTWRTVYKQSCLEFASQEHANG